MITTKSMSGLLLSGMILMLPSPSQAQPVIPPDEPQNQTNLLLQREGLQRRDGARRVEAAKDDAHRAVRQPRHRVVRTRREVGLRGDGEAAHDARVLERAAAAAAGACTCAAGSAARAGL